MNNFDFYNLFIYLYNGTMALVALNSYLVLLCFWVLSIFLYSEQNTKFRKLNLISPQAKM